MKIGYLTFLTTMLFVLFLCSFVVFLQTDKYIAFADEINSIEFSNEDKQTGSIKNNDADMLKQKGNNEQLNASKEDKSTTAKGKIRWIARNGWSHSARRLKVELYDKNLIVDTKLGTTYEVITLTFSDGTTVNVIDEHAFYDTTLNKYVFLRSDASQYIGHYFTKQILDGNNNMTQTTVQLVDVTIEEQITTAYSPVTYGHLCYYVNGMLSMPGNTESFINIFDVDPTTMSYDEDAMAQDIATYGLYTYEEFNNIIPIPQLVFDAFNGQYLKVAIGKGITTLQEIQALLNRYSEFFE